MRSFYAKCSVITRLTLCISSIITKLGGLQGREIGEVQLGASTILKVIYNTYGLDQLLFYLSLSTAKVRCMAGSAKTRFLEERCEK